jgi:hypothetical protein
MENGNFISTDTTVKLYCFHHFRMSYMNYMDEGFYHVNPIQVIFLIREVCFASLSTWNQLLQMVEASSVLCSKSYCCYGVPRTAITKSMISRHVSNMWLGHCHAVLTCHSYSKLYTIFTHQNRKYIMKLSITPDSVAKVRKTTICLCFSRFPTSRRILSERGMGGNWNKSGRLIWFFYILASTTYQIAICPIWL